MKDKLIGYLKRNIGENISLTKIDDVLNMPFYLKLEIDYYNLDIIGTKYILVEYKNNIPTIRNLEIQISKIKNLLGLKVIVFFESLSVYKINEINKTNLLYIVNNQRIRIVDNETSLIIAKESSYLQRTIINERPSIIALKVYLMFLHHNIPNLDIKLITEFFDISQISASRALNELFFNKLIDYTVTGSTKRHKLYFRVELERFIKLGLNYFDSPISKRYFSSSNLDIAYISGIHALSMYSNIDDNGEITCALYYKLLNDNLALSCEDGDIKVEIWKIDPALFAKAHIVNPFLLACTMKNQTDERIRLSIREMIKNEYNIWID